MKALILSADDFEDSELLVPYYRMKEARIDVDVASTGKGTITGKHGYQMIVDKTLEEVQPRTTIFSSFPAVERPQSSGRKRRPSK